MSQYATQHVAPHHNFDPDAFAITQEYWSSDASAMIVDLPARPKRDYALEEVITVCGEALRQTYYSRYNRSLHYAELRRALFTPETQLSRRAARAIWTLFTYEKRFIYGTFTFDDRQQVMDHLDGCDLDREPDEAELLKECQQLYTTFCASYSSSEFITQAPVIGLLALLVGVDVAWRIWSQVVPASERGAICDYLPHGDEDSECALAESILGAREPDEPVSEYLISSLVRVPDESMLARHVEQGYVFTMLATRHSREIARRHGGAAAWVAWLAHVRRDYPEEARVIYTSPEVLHDYVIAQDFAELAQTIQLLPHQMEGKVQEAFMKRLLAVHHHVLVEAMLSVYDRPIVGRYAREWLLTEGANAIHGLATCLVTTKMARRARALELLRHYQVHSEEALMQAGLDGLSEEVLDTVRKLVTEHSSTQVEEVAEEDRPDWLVALAQDKKLGRKRLPEFVGELPVVLSWYGARLSDSDVVLLCKALKESTLETPHVALSEFQQWLDAGSAASLAWFLYRAWMRDKAKSTHKWALWTLAFLGDGMTPETLRSEMTKWPNVRAKWGVAVLVWLGSSEAVRALLTFVRQRKHNAIWRHSSNGLRSIARQREVPLAVLEDESVPDFGFDEQGSRLFDYGERKFWLRLDEQLKPRFFDQQKDKYVNSLPRITKVDDLEIAERSRAQYAQDKKRLQSTIKEERARFEVMLRQRRIWRAEHWERAMCHHPLLHHFATRLIWHGDVLDGAGEPRSCAFRLLRDRTLADASDEPVQLAPEARVSLFHPAQVDREELMQWAEVMTDYEIIQPFDQLSLAAHKYDDMVQDGLIKASLPKARLSRPNGLALLGWNFATYEATSPRMFKSYEDHGLSAMCTFTLHDLTDYDVLFELEELSFVAWTPGEDSEVVADDYSDLGHVEQSVHLDEAERVPPSNVDLALLVEAFDEIQRCWTED